MKRLMPGRFVIVVAFAVANGVAIAQQPQAQTPARFEAAVIKPGNPKLLGMSSTSTGPSGGQFKIVNKPLTEWIEIGLSVPDYALRAPSWLESSRFDLVARLPAGKPVTEAITAEMVKNLLIERFGLKWHEETQDVSGYQLLTEKKILMKSPTVTERLFGIHGGGSGPSTIDGANMPMSELAQKLGTVVGRPVVDATHLSGGFTFKMLWRPSNEAAAADEKRHGIDVDNLPDSVFTALREQLGLRLQSAKVPGRVIVIDHINNQPSAN